MIICNKIIGVDRGKIVFSSFGGKYYSSNPRVISEKLNELYPNAKIIWLFKNPHEKRILTPNYIRIVKFGSLRAFREIATSKIWIDDVCKPLFLYKSKKQIYIQTWHGDRGFKKVALSSPNFPSNKVFESKKCDLMISGSDYGDKKYIESFDYKGEIFKYGCPRNDILVRDDITTKTGIKSNYGIKKKTKVLLFAPTFEREAAKRNKLQSIEGININKILDTLEKKTNEKWIGFVRSHSGVKGLKGVHIDDKRIFNGNNFEEMNELLLITDFLITDYSSSAGDFALLNRPIVLYHPNKEKRDGTLTFDIDTSPYIVAKNNKELIEKISLIDCNNIEDNCKEILKFYGAVETGESTERVVKYIIENVK